MSTMNNINQDHLEKGPGDDCTTENQLEDSKLEVVPTHDDLHLNNELAYKGDDSDGKVSWTVRRFIAAFCLCTLYTSSQIMMYYIGATLSYVQADLHNFGSASWLPVSNTLAVAASAPFSGYLQDLLGRRNITLLGLIVVMVGIVIAGTAHQFGQAVAGLAISGVGAGICELSSMAGLSDIFPVKHRGYALAMMACGIIPIIPYVLYCQVLASRATWRWTQWISLIWNGVVFIGLVFCYFPQNHPRMEGFSRRRILRNLDYIGAVLSITGITLMLVALSAGGYSHAWASAYVLCQFIIGIFLLAAWVVWEIKFAKFPMLPKVLFQGQRVVGLIFILSFVAGMTFYSIVNFLPLLYQAVFSPDPVQVGLRSLAYGVLTTVATISFTALISTKLGARYVLLTGFILMTTFAGSMASVTPDNLALAVALGGLCGFGSGSITVPSSTVALMAVPDSLLATTAAWTLSLRTIGGSFGYTIYYNIFRNKLTKVLPKYIAEYAIAAGLPPKDAEAFVITFLTKPEEIATAVGFSPAIAEAATLGDRWAYAYSLKYVWFTSIAFGSVAVITCLFVPSVKKYKTNRVAVYMG